MPVRALFVSADRNFSSLPWAGPDLLVDTLRDIADLPFRLLRKDVDVIVTMLPLPWDLGPHAVPVMRMEDIPADPRSAWETIRRVASQGSRSAPPDTRQMLSQALRQLDSDIARAGADISQLQRQMTDLLPPLVAAVQGLRGASVATLGQTAAADARAAAPAAPLRSPAPSPYQPAEVPPAIASPSPADRAAPDPVPVTVLVGPVRQLPMIETLVDDLEYAPGLTLQFRVFRDGVYQIDGQAISPRSLTRWLEARADVASVSVAGATVHVTPRIS